MPRFSSDPRAYQGRSQEAGETLTIELDGEPVERRFTLRTSTGATLVSLAGLVFFGGHQSLTAN